MHELFTKLQTKISWLLFMTYGVNNHYGRPIFLPCGLFVWDVCFIIFAMF